MVLGFERINARVKQPNERINFIKPLEGPHKNYAQDFLERIAAICNPIMKKHSLVVMALEEYAYNTEFLGRNFNAGEVIQLVLKSKSGNWLPFRFVQMVMMHELAHCKQMNHSGAFWKVKNTYSDELKELWDKGYTGEGMWSRGRTLLSGEYVNAGLAADDILPEHLCGGTYRTSGKRKRAAKPKLNWKEQKERRIKKKFGVDGKTLGADDAVKAELEQGKKTKGKPRVAGSNRGRELRAAAAQARHESLKEGESDAKDENDISTDSGSETDGDDDIKTEPGEAVDIDGSKLHDQEGRTMVKVCDDEEKDDVNVKNEMDELDGLRHVAEKEDVVETESEEETPTPFRRSKSKSKDRGEPRKYIMMDFGPEGEPEGQSSDKDGSETEGTPSQADLSEASEYSKSKPASGKRRLVSRAAARPSVIEGSETNSEELETTPRKPTGSFVSPKPKRKSVAEEVAKARTEEFFNSAARRTGSVPPKAAPRRETPEVSVNPPFDIQARAASFSPSPALSPAPVAAQQQVPDPDFPTALACPVCSVDNDIQAATCAVCGNVLDEAQVEGTWKCTSDICKDGSFINAGDYGVCNVCGAGKPLGV